MRLISEADRQQIRSRLDAERAARVRAGNAQTVAAIDRALRQLDTPSYGYCRACGVRIATTRLLEVPHTEHCLVCA